LILNERLLVTGDDVGCVKVFILFINQRYAHFAKVWDTRTREAVQEYTNCTDYISDFAYCEERNTILATRSVISFVVLCFSRVTDEQRRWLSYGLRSTQEGHDSHVRFV
jgi:hypothetical protein